jgi:predicted metal-dependent peptidase
VSDLSDDERKLFARARLEALHHRPYFASLLFALRPAPCPGLGTVGVDLSGNLYIDFATFRQWSLAERAGALVHEASHVLRGHHRRAQRAGAVLDAVTWNVAADLEINDDIGLELPDGALDPNDFALPSGQLAEWYYEALPHDEPNRAHTDCGSCVDGRRRPWEVAGGALTESELDSIRRSVAEAIRNAPPGSTPDADTRWANAELEPEVNWRSVLRATVTGVGRSVGSTHWTYARPSRRRAPGPGPILPSTYTPRHRVALVIDTSASMGQADLDRVATEALALCRAIPGVEVDVYSCDAAATHEGVLPPGRTLTLTGGGGTDLTIGIDAAVRARPRPSIVIVATDGCTPWPATPTPNVPVVALLVGDSPPPPPDWIRTVSVRDAPSPWWPRASRFNTSSTRRLAGGT